MESNNQNNNNNNKLYRSNKALKAFPWHEVCLFVDEIKINAEKRSSIIVAHDCCCITQCPSKFPFFSYLYRQQLLLNLFIHTYVRFFHTLSLSLSLFWSNFFSSELRMCKCVAVFVWRVCLFSYPSHFIIPGSLQQSDKFECENLSSSSYLKYDI